MTLQRTASGQLLMTASGSLSDDCCCGGPGSCSWTLSPSSASLDCFDQNGTFNVNTLVNCGWSASVTIGGSFLSIASGGSGSTSGLLTFHVTSNSTGLTRNGAITVITTTDSTLGPPGSFIGLFNLAQTVCGGNVGSGGGGNAGPDSGPPPTGALCNWGISPGSGVFDCNSQTGTFNVNTLLGCGWSASVITGGIFWNITSGSFGSGPGTVVFNLTGNPGAARGAQILVVTTVASTLGPIGSTIGVYNMTQLQCAGGGGVAPCEWEINPNRWFIADPCNTSTGETDVTTGIGCSWNAVVISGGSFITITSGSSGLSSGTIVYDVTQNETSLDRSGMIEVRTSTGSIFGPVGTLISQINISQGPCLLIEPTMRAAQERGLRANIGPIDYPNRFYNEDGSLINGVIGEPPATELRNVYYASAVGTADFPVDYFYKNDIKWQDFFSGNPTGTYIASLINTIVTGITAIVTPNTYVTVDGSLNLILEGQAAPVYYTSASLWGGAAPVANTTNYASVLTQAKVAIGKLKYVIDFGDEIEGSIRMHAGTVDSPSCAAAVGNLMANWDAGSWLLTVSRFRNQTRENFNALLPPGTEYRAAVDTIRGKFTKNLTNYTSGSATSFLLPILSGGYIQAPDQPTASAAGTWGASIDGTTYPVGSIVTTGFVPNSDTFPTFLMACPASASLVPQYGWIIDLGGQLFATNFNFTHTV